MKEIKCPHCGEVFSVDEADYALLLNQVKNAEFHSEVERRVKELESQWRSRQQLEAQKAAYDHQNETTRLKTFLQAKDNELQLLKSRLDNLERIKDAEKANALLQKDNAINELKTQARMREENLVSAYNNKVKELENQVDYYKNFKTSLSTKMVGESLEQHCAVQYEQYLRPYMPNAEFGKDNDDKLGSKGDFIFRDRVDDMEYISIMFEMKNEMDTTEKKHRNDEFFAKLDKDRKQKGCEYAVLVSMLEADNEFYNNGIVMVHQYEKMYVIRPQFFVPLITLLVQTNRKTVEYQRELALIREKEVDVTNFEAKLDDMKAGFSHNVGLAHDQYNKAIDAIDKSIRDLEAVKENLMKSGNNLRLANNKLQDITIRKLTYNNPTMKKLFQDAAGEDAVEHIDSHA